MGESFDNNKPVEIVAGVPKDVQGLRKELMNLLSSKMSGGATSYGGPLAAGLDPLQRMASNILSQQMYGQNYAGGAGTYGAGGGGGLGLPGSGGSGPGGGSFNPNPGGSGNRQVPPGGTTTTRGGGSYLSQWNPAWGDPSNLDFSRQPARTIPSSMFLPATGAMPEFHDPLYGLSVTYGGQKGAMG